MIRKISIALNLIAAALFLYLSFRDSNAWLLAVITYATCAACIIFRTTLLSHILFPQVLCLIYTPFLLWTEYQNVTNNIDTPNYASDAILVFVSIVTIFNLVTSNIILREDEASYKEKDYRVKIIKKT